MLKYIPLCIILFFYTIVFVALMIRLIKALNKKYIPGFKLYLDNTYSNIIVFREDIAKIKCDEFNDTNKKVFGNNEGIWHYEYADNIFISKLNRILSAFTDIEAIIEK